ncbi:C6 transcription factor [Aspergillus costaricaensis CBS 115574]|uniref:C6 transcription factor n=1 Tax=Aspergillus costaricaensis CBS 115574 TaxID=1448317 RepID=A0ACD1I2G7_9EURO|nr:C6 transcription factor [Aspergillus costaricaensis CBS 115574]RAK84427.1 C6 transcription factor [Aspergillus costaricaensis CBS 115574]
MNTALTTRSCRRCSQKKIRCNKAQPCASCIKSASEQLVSRLKSLEKEVQTLTEKLETVNHDSRRHPHPAENSSAVKGERGKLFVDRGSSQYINHEVLVDLETQVGRVCKCGTCTTDRGPLGGSYQAIQDSQHCKHRLGKAKDESGTQEVASIGRERKMVTGNGFVFQYSPMAVSLSDFYPSSVQHSILWDLFEENVAPLTMIFHKPSLAKTLNGAAATTIPEDRASEAVRFAVCFAAITSMDPERCKHVFDQERGSLQQHYRFATEQALARANFLQSHNLTVLQATILYLTCLRGEDDAAFIWAMTAAVHRIAQGLGLHRGGTHLGLNPFQTEVRRRIWWAFYLLDCQSSEFSAVGTQIKEGTYDTRLPLNIHDSDISLESRSFPDERSIFTDMTFCLIRCEMTVLNRQLHLDLRSSSGGHVEESSLNTLRRLHGLKQIHSRLRRRYLDYCDVSIPFQWVTVTVIRLALARSWLIAHLSEGMSAAEQILVLSNGEALKRERLFVTAIEVLEFAYLLETDPRTKQWSWLFEGYPQLHAAVFVLRQIGVGPQTMLTDRAWAVAYKVVTRWRNNDLQKNGVTSALVSRIMAQAAVAQGCIWDGGEIKDESRSPTDELYHRKN